jgi:hypothetical protein
MATAARKTRVKAQPAPEPEEIEDDDLEVDEVDEEIEEDDEDEAPAPVAKKKTAAKKAPAKAAEPEALGTAWLVEYVNEQTGKTYNGAAIRIGLRKMAKTGTLDRTVGEDRARYAFSGPKDPIVVAFLKLVKGGALEKDRAEKLAALKDKGTAAKAKGAAKKKAAPVVDEDDVEDMEDDE